MEDWMRDECLRRGYPMVFTPHVMRRELWKVSGHEGFYAGTCTRPWNWTTPSIGSSR
jgi:threonyl-tRNA synthetase